MTAGCIEHDRRTSGVFPLPQVRLYIEQGTDREARRRRAALMGITEEELDADDFDIAQLFPGARRGTDGT